jgi:isocitrate dehydrogenase
MTHDERGRRRVTVLPGDGIGPEVVDATCLILDAAGASIRWEPCVAGAEAFRNGDPTGVPPETVRSLRETRVALKGPLETPVGFGEKSANVTLRKLFETFANIRPVREWPGVTTPFTGRGIDLVVVRENVEDVYAGIEHMQTPGVAQCLKLVTRHGCEQVSRVAFELARGWGRRRVTCVTKANIMKLTEGMLKRTFEEVAREYPDIQSDHILVDNCAHQLARNPERFDVLVSTNMNGDILSDLTSGLIGGLGFAPGVNLGREVAIFEAVHGTAPDIAGRGVANPTAMLLSGILMLRHIGQDEAASRVERALADTLASRTATADVRREGAASTQAFAEAIIRRLGEKRVSHAPAPARAIRLPEAPPRPRAVVPAERRTVGVDVFLESQETANTIGDAVRELTRGTPFYLKMISNRGARVYPDNGAITECVDHWRCRFILHDPKAAVHDAHVLDLLLRIGARWRWMHVEKLELIDGAPGWTRAQGELGAIDGSLP